MRAKDKANHDRLVALAAESLEEAAEKERTEEIARAQPAATEETASSARN
jgi:hypothetical protein